MQETPLTRQPSMEMMRQLSSMDDWEEEAEERQTKLANTRQMQNPDDPLNQELINKLQRGEGKNPQKPWYRRLQGGTRKRKRSRRKRSRSKRSRRKLSKRKH